MKRSFVWYLNVAMLIVVAAMLMCCRTAPVKTGEPVAYILPRVRNAVEFFYSTVMERAKLEGAFCMGGRIIGKSVILSSLWPIHIDSAGEGTVFLDVDSCRDTTYVKDYIGVMHFHPNLIDPSPNDICWAHYNKLPVMAIAFRPQGEMVLIKTFLFADVRAAYDSLPDKGVCDRRDTGGIYTIEYRTRRPP